MRVLVLGASGLLGHTIFRVLTETTQWSVSGAVRNPKTRELFPGPLAKRIVVGGDLEDPGQLSKTFYGAAPDIVVNCLSVAKGELREDNLRKVVSNLSVLPQRISHACAGSGARLIHFSSDGVFSGTKGGYSEDDPPDATDVYGMAKFLGEVRDPHAISIRTSMIGHELQAANGLLEWFLSQEGKCTCFRRAIFSGLPTVELARILRDFVITRPDLSGSITWPSMAFPERRAVSEDDSPMPDVRMGNSSGGGPRDSIDYGGQSCGRQRLLEWFAQERDALLTGIFPGRGTRLAWPAGARHHVAAHAISKFDLLRLVAEVYGKTIELVPDDRVVIDRSLNADRFRIATGYEAPDWPELIKTMHADHLRHSRVDLTEDERAPPSSPPRRSRSPQPSRVRAVRGSVERHFPARDHPPIR